MIRQGHTFAPTEAAARQLEIASQQAMAAQLTAMAARAKGVPRG